MTRSLQTSSNRLRKSGFALAGAAAATSLPLQTANAAIVYGTVGQETNNGSFSFDFNANNNAEFRVFGFDQFPNGSKTGLDNFNGGFQYVASSSDLLLVTRFDSKGGDSISSATGNKGSSSSFSSGLATGNNTTGGIFRNTLTSVGNWPVGSNGYMGFRFSNTGPVTYGWAYFELVDGNSLRLVDYAYETSGASILTGQGRITAVPEPGSAVLLAFGLATTAFVRRRRRKAARVAANAKVAPA